MASDATAYFQSNSNKMRCHVPAYERMMQLNALGHSVGQIVEILDQEFKDIDFNPYTVESVQKIMTENRAQFDEVKRNLGLKCREEIQEQTARLFAIVKDEEVLMVEVFANKMRQALTSLQDLDLNEKDDDGNYKNTSRVFVLTEMIIKLQSSIAKIVGTDALREVEVFRAKARAKREEEGDSTGLLPAHKAKGETVEVNTVWH